MTQKSMGSGVTPMSSGAVRSLLFPWIRKQYNGYGSRGMTKQSRVEDATALRPEAACMRDAFGAALIEEFVDGEEAIVFFVEDLDDRLQPRALRVTAPPNRQ